jgi:DeoR family transcriptional regulator, suf operon transcriptional repressor
MDDGPGKHPGTTRGRIVTLVRSGGLTADDIATRLGVTPSAVRIQLMALERDGMVRRAGKRPGTTRPSDIFELTVEAEQSLSKAYIPLLTRLVSVLTESVPARQLEAALRKAGRQLGRELSGSRPLPGDLRSRVAKASELLNEQLGAATHVERNGHYVIRGAGCPLAALSHEHRSACLALESLLTELVGVRVKECCDRAERPRCCFEIPTSTQSHKSA